MNNRPAWSRTPGSNIDKVDSRLTGALERAAETFARENPGYTVEGFSGKKGRSSGTPNHPAGRAVDVNIIGPDGKPLGNVRNAASFRAYEAYAQEVRRELDAVGLTDVGRWGGYFQQGVAFDQMHFDLGPRDQMAYGTWEDGLNKAGLKALPGAVSVGMNQISLPNTMQAPQTLAQVQAQDRAYANLEAQRARALSAMPAPSLERPNPMPGGLMAYAPPSTFRPDNLNRSLFGRDSFAPAPSVNAAASIPSVPATGRDRFGPATAQTTVATRPSTPAPTSLPSARPTQVASIGRPDYASIAGTEIGRMAGPAPARAPSTADLAAAYGQYASTRAAADKAAAEAQAYADFEAQRAKAFSAMPAPSYPAAPTAPIAPAPPAAVLAPALAPPKEVKDYPVADIAMAPPKATASDVYAGLADTALDNTGQNTVSRDAFGNTTVANPYGATTAMTPGGYQSAYGNLPSLPGISGPVKGALPGIAGSMVGGYLGGPVGAIAGGLLGKAFAPGGIFSGTKKIDTSQIPAALGLPAVTAFARPNNSLNSFPSAPSGGYRGSASFSNRSRGEMADISPAAADAIGRGLGGLY